MQNQFEFTLSYFKCTVILPWNCATFTLADNERCARRLTDNIHQVWQCLGVYSFEVLLLHSVLFFAKHLKSFLACRFFLCHIILPFKSPNGRRPEVSTAWFCTPDAKQWNYWTCSSLEAAREVCMVQNPTMTWVCVSHISIPQSQILT